MDWLRLEVRQKISAGATLLHQSPWSKRLEVVFLLATEISCSWPVLRFSPLGSLFLFRAWGEGKRPLLGAAQRAERALPVPVDFPRAAVSQSESGRVSAPLRQCLVRVAAIPHIDFLRRAILQA